MSGPYLFRVCVYQQAMNRSVFWFSLLSVFAALLSPARAAAAKAEYDALDRDQVINGFEWSGPDGASGLIIISSEFPSVYGMGGCRRLVHLIRHPGDGGVNPTFDSTVCRDWEGRWSVREK
jgi:surface antigen